MIKTFTALTYKDESYTGGGIEKNTMPTEQIDKEINAFAKKMGYKVTKVDFSSVNENIDHGNVGKHIEKRIWLVAVAHFIKR